MANLEPAVDVIHSTYKGIIKQRYLRRRPRLASVATHLHEYRCLARVMADPFYRRRLYSGWHNWKAYISHDEIVAVLNHIKRHVIGDDAEVLDHKGRFWRRCQSSGLPTIPIILEAGCGASTRHGHDDEFKCELFSKPADMNCGKGVAVWHYSDDGYRAKGVGHVTLQGLIDHLERQPGQFVLQPKIINHRALLPISGKGLSTARIVTMRAPEGELGIGHAIYRMAVGSSVADNFAAGGLAAPISLDDGRLGMAVKKAKLEEYSHHPDSGAEIAGYILPDWAAVKALVLAAHCKFQAMPTVGWDVAITDDGPLLVEGNSIWCVELLQMAYHKPIGNGPVGECLAAHLRLV